MKVPVPKSHMHQKVTEVKEVNEREICVFPGQCCLVGMALYCSMCCSQMLSLFTKTTPTCQDEV